MVRVFLTDAYESRRCDRVILGLRRKLLIAGVKAQNDAVEYKLTSQLAEVVDKLVDKLKEYEDVFLVFVLIILLSKYLTVINSLVI